MSHPAPQKNALKTWRLNLRISLLFIFPVSQVVILLSGLQISGEPHPGLYFQPFKILTSSSFTTKLWSTNSLTLWAAAWIKQLIPCRGHRLMPMMKPSEACWRAECAPQAPAWQLKSSLFHAEDLLLRRSSMGSDLSPSHLPRRWICSRVCSWLPQPRNTRPCYYGQPSARRMIPVKDAAGPKFQTCCREDLRFSDHTRVTPDFLCFEGKDTCVV